MAKLPVTIAILGQNETRAQHMMREREREREKEIKKERKHTQKRKRPGGKSII